MRVFGVILALFLVGFLGWIFFPTNDFVANRQTIVLASSPMTIVSLDKENRVVTIISIDPDLVTEGTHGYGSYSLSAFWRLGQIDKKDGSVLSESLEETFGIPIRGYLGPVTGDLPTYTNQFTFVKEQFSFWKIGAFLSGKVRTNLQFRQFVSLVWRLHVQRPERVDTLDFRDNREALGVEVTLPDGSKRVELDKERIDAILKQTFEDETVRREAVTVAVYNTTGMPSLGNRVARLLGHLGVSIVTVGNDEKEVDVCVIEGTNDHLESASAHLIRDVLGCSLSPVNESGRADLVVRIGSVYAKRFTAN